MFTVASTFLATRFSRVTVVADIASRDLGGTENTVDGGCSGNRLAISSTVDAFVAFRWKKKVSIT